MLAAMKWIKWAGLAGLLVSIAVMWGLLQHGAAERVALTRKLNHAIADNKTNLATIATLNDEAGSANRLLVQRQMKWQQQQRELNHDITFLRNKMATIECVIPDVVTQRLRAAY